MATVLAIPDLHAPFEHQDAFDFITAVAAQVRPDVVVNLGDEIDMCAYSRYLKDPDGLGPLQEFESAVENLQKWFKAFPKVFVCHSNHTTRAAKKVLESGVPSRFMKSIKEVLGAPKQWQWNSGWIIDGVMYIHGEGFSGISASANAALSYGQPVVLGHIHAHAGVQYVSSFGYNLWGVNSGCLIDSDAYAFAYAKFSRHKPILGATVIVDGKFPRFIPMVLNKSGKRWIGRV